MKQKLPVIAAALILAATITGCGANVSQNTLPSVSYISTEAAQILALSNAKIAAADAKISVTELVEVEGIPCYQVEFTADGQSYACAVHAETGEIVTADYRGEFTVEPVPEVAAPQPSDTVLVGSEKPAVSGQIDEVTAKEIALNHAGVSARDAIYTKCRIDYENGRHVYEIEWYANGAKYEYDIAVDNGAIVSMDYEAVLVVGTSNQPLTTSAVTLEQAKQTALDHAKVRASEATFLKAERDYEDGRLVYEVEFVVVSGKTVTEYDYEIDANTGAVVSYDYDIENYTPVIGNTTGENASTGTAVSTETAKQIALARVPGATAANLYEWESDYDDGRLEYEGKIIYNGMEYEFTIDAATGNITEWEVEPWGK